MAGIGDDFEGYPHGQTWADGSAPGPWRTVFTGYGAVAVVTERPGDRILGLAPKAPGSPAETHAALVVSKQQFGDLRFAATIRTVRHLRSGPANPWEVGWLVWHVHDADHFYYLALKPNGWEIGKADPAGTGGQRFLAADDTVTFPVGPWRRVEIQQTGATINVSVDGTPIASVTDGASPYTSGGVGFYSEDAEVQVDDATVS